MLHGFATHVSALSEDQSVRAVLVIGTGRTFCAGGDVNVMNTAQTPAVCEAHISTVYDWVSVLRQSHTVLIMVVNGVAAGGGLPM